jgi:hypothetical protein
MEVVQFIYNEKTIDFEPAGKDNVMVNATQMAKVFGKEVTHFLENEGTKMFIDACLNTRNSEYLAVQKREDLVFGKQRTGTWMHRILALKFAAWLDPDFEVWVYSTIDKIILGHYYEQKEATIEKLTYQEEMRQLREDILAESPKFALYLEKEKRISAAELKRMKATRAATNQLKLQFYPETK